MSPTAITYRIYETFFLLDCTQFNHFFKITKLNSKDLPAWRSLRYGHVRQCEMKKSEGHQSISVRMKKVLRKPNFPSLLAKMSKAAATL